LLAALLSPLLTQAQWNVSLFGGFSNYNGDLQSQDYTTQQSHLSFGAGIQYDLSMHFSLLSNLTYGKVGASDSYSPFADLRARTATLFGLPEGEHIEFELVTDQPWSGFNYYLGNLSSRVAVNTDLPVLSTSLAHLVAHEAYPGHHTEHTRKEVGLVRRRRWLEESIFLVGTPQCLLAEGLADLGLEVVMGRHPEATVAEHMHALGIRYDTEVVGAVSTAGEALGGVRQNAAFRLHEDGADPEVVIDEVARWGLLSRDRAAKSVEFLTHPTWRAYLTCYVEGLPLCRAFVNGDPARFDRLLSEQLTPDGLADQIRADATVIPGP